VIWQNTDSGRTLLIVGFILRLQSDDNHICEGEYYRRVSSLCGGDLLCRSQSRRLLSGLGDFHEMEEDFSKGTQEQMGALCSRDHCLSRFWKRR
jgi:hypothetical protein